MKSVQIHVTPRTHTGESASRNERRIGRVPCNIYGAGRNMWVIADERELHKIIFTPEVLLANLVLGENTQLNAIVREVQFHPVTDRIMHVDFLEVVENKPVTLKLPVRIIGNAAGVKAGGKLKTVMRKLEVEGLIKDLPDSIQIDVTELEIGASIRIKDLSAPGIRFLDTPNNVVVSVATTRASQKEEAAQASK